MKRKVNLWQSLSDLNDVLRWWQSLLLRIIDSQYLLLICVQIYPSFHAEIQEI